MVASGGVANLQHFVGGDTRGRAGIFVAASIFQFSKASIVAVSCGAQGGGVGGAGCQEIDAVPLEHCIL